MKKKKAQARLKAKENVALASNIIKMRRCEIKLHRFRLDGSLNRNNSAQTPKSLLREQQSINAADSNLKRTESKALANQETPQQKVKKCVVKLKRIDANSDLKQNTMKPSRNPLLALTRRRAIELGLKSQTETQNSSDNADCTETQLSLLSKTPSPRNLADKPNAIADLLFSEDEHILNKTDVELNKIPPSTGNQSKVTHKFFHKENKRVLSVKNKENTRNTKTTNEKRKKIANKTQKNKRSITRPSKDSNKAKDVYEFLSQSQTTDSDSKMDKDVASDIVKKLINEGKVAVAKNYKGRPRVKPQPKKKRKVKIKTTNENPVISTNFDVDGALYDGENEDVPNNDMELPTVGGNDVVLPTAGSTFSELARSVLARQHIENGRTALEILQRYNSTPFKLQNTSPQLPAGNELSPIPSFLRELSKSHATNSRNELPSVSGTTKTTHIAKPKVVPAANGAKRLFDITLLELPSSSGSCQARSNDRSVGILEQPSCSGYSAAHSSRSSNKTFGRPTATVATLSSFSSNDSNAENQPPAKQPNSTQTPESHGMRKDENDVIHSARQIPNPRRTLAHRSPLKAINIIDIVALPPYTGPMAKNTKDCEKSHNDKYNEKSQLFGFEEYLDEDDEIEENVAEPKSRTNTQSKLNMSRQLRKLKRLRPKSTAHSRSAVNSTIAKSIFDDYGGKPMGGNRNIKEMLCSTMVNKSTLAEQESTTYSTNTLATEYDSDEDSDDTVSANKSREKKEAELFGDPETTFDQKSFRRTYERPAKRKRKLLHQFSDIFDSDDEHTDDEIDALNTSVGKAHKPKKRQVKSPKNEELNKFVSEFNSMLKEAEDYELIVE